MFWCKGINRIIVKVLWVKHAHAQYCSGDINVCAGWWMLHIIFSILSCYGICILLSVEVLTLDFWVRMYSRAARTLRRRKQEADEKWFSGLAGEVVRRVRWPGEAWAAAGLSPSWLQCSLAMPTSGQCCADDRFSSRKMTAGDSWTAQAWAARIYLGVCAQSYLTLCDPMDCRPPGSSVHGDSPGKNTGEGCHFLLQGIFPTQELNPRLSRLLSLLHWQDSLLLCHLGST